MMKPAIKYQLNSHAKNCCGGSFNGKKNSGNKSKVCKNCGAVDYFPVQTTLLFKKSLFFVLQLRRI